MLVCLFALGLVCSLVYVWSIFLIKTELESLIYNLIFRLASSRYISNNSANFSFEGHEEFKVLYIIKTSSTLSNKYTYLSILETLMWAIFKCLFILLVELRV